MYAFTNEATRSLETISCLDALAEFNDDPVLDFKPRCESKETVVQSSLVASCGLVASSSLLGAVCGLLLAAMGSAISSSIVGVAIFCLAAVLLGVWLGGLRSAVVCAVCAPLVVALVAVMGGSALGGVSTVAICGLLGGWRGWVEAMDASTLNKDWIL